jgi:iron complex outermembrane receptor protein
MSSRILPRRARRSRLALRSALAFALPLAGAAAPAHAQAPAGPAGVAIAPGPLSAALAAYAANAGVLLSFDPALTQGLHTAGLSGSYSFEEGLRRLLAGSGLTPLRRSDGSYTLRPEPQGATTLPAVTVHGAAETAWGPVGGYVARRSATGTKTDTPLIETPQSISVVSREQIEDTGATTLGEALRYTAGILSQEGNDRTTDGFVMRGFQLSGYGSIYRDGMKYMGNVYDGTQEPYGMERVEVLRGAASVLYGQASPGGLVNVTSKLPTAEPLHELRTSLGNHSRYELATDHGGKLTEDGTWTYRLTALARDSDTMVDYVPDNRTYIAPALRWQPSAATSMTFLGTYQRTRTAYVYGLPAIGTLEDSSQGRVPTRRFTGEPGYDKSETRFYDIGYRFEHAFNDAVTVRQNLRYFSSRNELPSVNLGDFVPGTGDTVIDRGAQDRVDHSDNFVVDTQLQVKGLTGPLAHTLLAGVDYAHRRHRSERYNRTLAPLDLYHPVYGAEPGVRVPAFNSSTSSDDRLGVYLQDQVKIADKWVVLLGGRYDWSSERTNAIFFDAKEKTDSEAFTGRAGLVYLADNGLAPFVSFSQSFEPTSGVDRGGSPFKPTRGEQYEAGVRYQPAGSDTLISASVYQLTQKNVLTPDPLFPTDFQVQTGEVRSRGFELEARSAVGAHGRIIASYAYTNAEITRSNDPAEVGQRRGMTPRNTVSLWGDYRLAALGLPRMRIGAGVRYIGSTLGLFNTAIEVPSYTIVDAMMSYDAGPWQFTLNANNLTDRVYVASYSYGAFYGPRRSVIGTLAYRW